MNEVFKKLFWHLSIIFLWFFLRLPPPHPALCFKAKSLALPISPVQILDRSYNYA